ncbi:alpha/beta hydrolase [Porphyrobacter sp. ULC335]|uniref:alpha/beta hydrolase n=1 Tax=Porphyrobacter sp. ULC335 TaxID=2854260 RepID=UPI002220AB86|nr:alpha/beta hydrolase [Porphyrobacter sp. ULC335]UYV14975.1 alpha/beta hydrolase [Porphyrobacter sp. ULC335]
MMKHASSTFALAILLAGCAPVTPPVPDTSFAVTDTRDYDPVTLDAVPSDPPTLRVAYGTASARQYGELRVPEGKGPFPIAVIYHGGCWMGLGSTANVAALGSFLARNGVAVWAPGYRELGSDGGWPNTFTDWAQGLGYVQTLAETHPLDLKRITVMGHSAGVTPVMWLPTGDMGDDVIRPDLPRVRAAVAIDGPLRISDFVGLDAMACGQPVIAGMMGGTPAEVPARYAMLDPLANKPLVKRLLVVDGAVRDPDPALIEGLRAQGIAVEVIRVDQEQHFNMLVPGTKDFAAIAPALLDIAKGR